MSNYKQKYYKYKFKYLLTKQSVTTPHVGGAPPIGRLSADEIIENFYLCTESRHKEPITDFLRPFGSFDELDKLYPDNSTLIKGLKEEISDVIIVGNSQYGLYFRLVKKKLVDDFTIKNSDNVEFKRNRSFIFKIPDFLNYIQNQNIPNVPLFYYSDSNTYGYESYSDALFSYKSDIPSFLQNIGNTLSSSLYKHELVSRLPIPLNHESGFIGVINDGILSFNHYDEEFKEQNIEERIANDRIRCNPFKDNEQKCKESQCWYYKNGKCGPHFTQIRDYIY